MNENSKTEPANLIFEWDTQSSGKKLHWAGEIFFLTLGFKDVPESPLAETLKQLAMPMQILAVRDLS